MFLVNSAKWLSSMFRPPFALRTLLSVRSFKGSAYGYVMERKTAGIIIIGNEILRAQVKDTNSYFVCDLLYKCGVKVKKISVIGDDVEEIKKEIQEFSARYNYVVTSGGIGPTHDDVTYEALAKAFDDELHYDPTMVSIIEKLFKNPDRSSPAYKMAKIPRKAILRFGVNGKTGQKLTYPRVTLGNVYVFPGSPTFLEKSFESLCAELFDEKRPFAKDELFLDANEESFAKALDIVAEEFPNVTFGSYPEISNKCYRARVTVESEDEETTKSAVARFRSLVPPTIFVDVSTKEQGI